MKHNMEPSFPGFRMKWYIFYTHLLASMRSCSAHSLSERCCTSSRMFMVLWKWPQDRLTLTAVSCLSPVRTHTLIPASRRASMVSWTLSWSLKYSRNKENAMHIYSMVRGEQSPLFHSKYFIVQVFIHTHTRVAGSQTVNHKSISKEVTSNWLAS